MQTKHFIGDSGNDPQNNHSNGPQPPIGKAPLPKPLPQPADEELEHPDALLVELARFKHLIYALPPDEQVVFRAMHGIGCDRFSPRQIARRLRISVKEVHRIEARASARLEGFYGIDEAA